MQVILLENIRNLGQLGDTVDVKAGYGRNYLIPEHKAVFATKANKAEFEQKRADLEKKAQQVLAQAEQRASKLNDITLIVEAEATDEGKLYGSIGVMEIKDALGRRDIEVSKREISLPDGPIHATGEYVIDVLLHSEVIASLKLEIRSK